MRYELNLSSGIEGSMLLKMIFVLLLVLSFIHSPAFAQLGPKEGSDLGPTDLQRIKVGQPAPDFTLEDMEGKSISLSDFRGKKTVVLVFYRGYW
jgi:cytochrome oxidase Cu insertion factor (SCO1/SenC/PrrC family)